MNESIFCNGLIMFDHAWSVYSVTVKSNPFLKWARPISLLILVFYNLPSQVDLLELQEHHTHSDSRVRPTNFRMLYWIFTLSSLNSERSDDLQKILRRSSADLSKNWDSTLVIFKTKFSPNYSKSHIFLFELTFYFIIFIKVPSFISCISILVFKINSYTISYGP